jgi:hypothetical protein
VSEVDQAAVPSAARAGTAGVRRLCDVHLALELDQVDAGGGSRRTGEDCGKRSEDGVPLFTSRRA